MGRRKPVGKIDLTGIAQKRRYVVPSPFRGILVALGLSAAFVGLVCAIGGVVVLILKTCFPHFLKGGVQ